MSYASRQRNYRLSLCNFRLAVPFTQNECPPLLVTSDLKRKKVGQNGRSESEKSSLYKSPFAVSHYSSHKLRMCLQDLCC